MKRFQIVTETDARVLEYGSAIVVVKGGHVTPLAADTLRSRRITVMHEGAGHEEPGLAPTFPVRTVAISGDHSSVALKAALVAHLRSRGLAAHDLGTSGTESVDYPDTAAAVARQVARGEADAGIVIDGVGLGSAIAATKIDGVRAAMCVSVTLARYARQHNGANVLALGATLVTVDEARAVVDTFIDTPMTEPRYVARLAKVRALER